MKKTPIEVQLKSNRFAKGFRREHTYIDRNMALYKVKHTFEAEQFRWGMEDGIIYGERVVCKNAKDFPNQAESKKHPGYLEIYDTFFDGPTFCEYWFRPYIETFRGKVVIKNSDDWIITNLNGDREVNTDWEFHQIYELI